uniref:RAB35, member RAS onco family n=1 Tax=Felis catus TaxID=9685 RepID=A0ABI7ZWG8_FELCA
RRQRRRLLKRRRRRRGSGGRCFCQFRLFVREVDPPLLKQPGGSCGSRGQHRPRPPARSSPARHGPGLRPPLQAAHHRRQRCGQEQFTVTFCRQHFLRYYRGTHGVIVVYDVTSAESFVNVKRWLHEINQNCDDVCRILVGNKNDDPERKVVETEDAYKFAGQMGIQLFETSAKENVNVEEMFNCITELVLRAKKDNLAKQQQQQQNDVVKLTKNSKRKKRCC